MFIIILVLIIPVLNSCYRRGFPKVSGILEEFYTTIKRSCYIDERTSWISLRYHQTGLQK